MTLLKLMNDETLSAAVAIGPGHGHLYVVDTAKQEADELCTKSAKLEEGTVEFGDCPCDVVSACLVSDPSIGIVGVAEAGDFTVNARLGVWTDSLFDVARPPSKNRRLHGIRSVCTIAGRAHVVGYGGMVYRLDGMADWVRIDEGIGPKVDLDAMDGFGPADLYLVGSDGVGFRLVDNAWAALDLPTDANFNAVKCAPDGFVYAAGSDGIIVRGRNDAWEVLEDRPTDDEIWSLAWFQGRLHASTMDSVYVRSASGWQVVQIGGKKRRSCYRLSVGQDVMWSMGEHELWEFAGDQWTRLV